MLPMCLFFFSVSVAVLFAESYILFQMYFLFCEIKDCTNLEFIYLEAAFVTCFARCLAVLLINNG